MPTGMGYDIHRLVAGRKLVLGGVPVPFEKGLLGHSDADVLVHALCDALLGAAGLGDIGEHFPDSDPAYRGISSLVLLQRTCDAVRAAGRQVSHVDATIIAERPRLTPYKQAMRETLSQTMGIETRRVNIKAKTAEGLGPVGRGEAIAAMCLATLERLHGKD
jgi:2-C-methyl-D-erythritol 2,4-cyclodiphosphate synthase